MRILLTKRCSPLVPVLGCLLFWALLRPGWVQSEDDLPLGGSHDRDAPVSQLRQLLQQRPDALVGVDTMQIRDVPPEDLIRYLGQAMIEVREMDLPPEGNAARLMARQLMAPLTAATPPDMAGMDLATVRSVAEPLGGNFATYTILADGGLSVLDVDITGRGLPAAVLATAVDHMLDLEAVHEEPALESRLAHLNQALSRSRTTTIVTILASKMDPAKRTLEIHNAGAPPPMILRRDSTEVLEGHAPALGIRSSVTFEPILVELDAGDCFIYASDGLLGAQNSQGERFGNRRMESIVRQGLEQDASAAQLAGRVVLAARKFSTSGSVPDDMMCTVLRMGLRTMALSGSTQMSMIWIPAGSFAMGRRKHEEQALRTAGLWSDAFKNEYPGHQVSISKGFYLGKYEVTQSQWEAVMGTNPSQYQSEQRPVENVSWLEVQQFIHRLNDAAGDSLYRLPSEAEWEYACRAGTETMWSSGAEESSLLDVAWYAANDSPYGSKPVGGKLPNPWGFYDMHGNVSEWCQDGWLRQYEMNSMRDPMGPESKAARMVRGGDFGQRAGALRCVTRSGNVPGRGYSSVGFRLARSATIKGVARRSAAR